MTAFVALSFGVSAFANQIAKDENFELEEEMVVDCYAVAEAELQAFIASVHIELTQREKSNAFNYYYDRCESEGNCTTCGNTVVVVGIKP